MAKYCPNCDTNKRDLCLQAPGCAYAPRPTPLVVVQAYVPHGKTDQAEQ